MRIEEEGDKPIWLPHHLNDPLMLQVLQQMLLAKEEGKEKESPRLEEKERRGQYVRSISPTGDALTVTNVLMLSPERCGATGRDLASCHDQNWEEIGDAPLQLVV